MRSFARDYLFVGLIASFACGASATTMADESPEIAMTPVNGNLVDGDMPAAYRLPPVAHGKTSTTNEAGTFVPQVAPSEEEFALEMPCFDDGWNHQQVVTEITPIAAEPASTFPYAPNTVELSAQLLPAVQRGYALAQRGAVSAAEAEFIQVLRRIAQAKDIQGGTDAHSQALAAGLRALDEAEDFVPSGIQLEAELDVRIVASSHRTPALKNLPAKILPHDAVARYHRYAHEQLARAVDGEQAGSIVLHGLGKVYVRIAERDDDLQAARTAMTLYLAAIETCPVNHLAANELGVLLCRNGHAAEAAAMFQQTIDLAPSATAYHNLATAQQKLGMHGQAAANEQESQRLAAWERANGAVSRRAGIEWVSPAEMAGVAQPAPLMPTAYNSASPSGRGSQLSSGEGAGRSRWQRTVEVAKSLPRMGKPEIGQTSPSATQWR